MFCTKFRTIIVLVVLVVIAGCCDHENEPTDQITAGEAPVSISSEATKELAALEARQVELESGAVVGDVEASAAMPETPVEQVDPAQYTEARARMMGAWLGVLNGMMNQATTRGTKNLIVEGYEILE